MKLDLAIEELHRSENELYTVLLAMSRPAQGRPRGLPRDPGPWPAWSEQHVAELAEVGPRASASTLDPRRGGRAGLLETAPAEGVAS